MPLEPGSSGLRPPSSAWFRLGLTFPFGAHFSVWGLFPLLKFSSRMPFRVLPRQRGDTWSRNTLGRTGDDPRGRCPGRPARCRARECSGQHPPDERKRNTFQSWTCVPSVSANLRRTAASNASTCSMASDRSDRPAPASAAAYRIATARRCAGKSPSICRNGRHPLHRRSTCSAEVPDHATAGRFRLAGRSRP